MTMASLKPTTTKLQEDTVLDETEDMYSDSSSMESDSCNQNSSEVYGLEPMRIQLPQWTAGLVWPLMLFVPLVLSSPLSPYSYREIFPTDWYEHDPSLDKPKQLGFWLGILSVVVGQFFTCTMFFLFKFGIISDSEPQAIQTKGAPSYQFLEGLATHLMQPSGFAMLGFYLWFTWTYNFLPKSYYSFEGTIQMKEVFLSLAVQDFYQYIMHVGEHVVNPTFYQVSHKPHHKFINPRIFDAFNGSAPDTFFMILVPLLLTAQTVRTCNVWSYMAFGSMFASWLTLIHAEYVFPWDSTFRRLGLGTPADHHVHHKFFKYNFGHTFMWSDWVFGTYRDPGEFSPRAFTKGA